MTKLSGYERVDLRRDRAAEVRNVASWGFAFTPKAQDFDALASIFEFERGRGIEIVDESRGAVGTLAAVHSSLAYPMRVPGGGTVPTSGLTWVAVHQAHRRRGLLTSMIADHFARSLERGEAVSTLYAAEPQIYQRFGYGLGCVGLVADLGRKPDFREVSGAADLKVRLESASLEAHADDVRAVQARMTRPGTVVEPGAVMMRSLFLDLESDRDHAEQYRIAIVDDKQGPAAYAIFARKANWEAGYTEGGTTVHTWGAATGPATNRLFRVISDLDLMVKTKAGNLAADDPLMFQLVDVRALKARVLDNIWVRILDVPRALEARSYAHDCEVVIEILDQQLPENAKVWNLSVRDGAATVSHAERGVPAQLRVGIQELSAAYLGGVTLESLAYAGLIEEIQAPALASLSAAMRGTELPISNFDF